ncbi:MAG TPA: peptide ABC transporter substrate-binding protein [Clostridia bacterium]
MKKRILLFFLCILMCMPVVAAGCGDKSDFVACVGSNPDTIDPALNSAVDGATYIIHAFSGLVTWRQNEDGALELVADCAEELPTPTIDEETGRATYVFKLKEGLKWSDGKELKASDFEYAWKRAASPELAADYGYMFEVIDGYYVRDENDNIVYDKIKVVIEDDEGNPVEVEEDTPRIGEINVKANDEERTLTVVLFQDVPYFYELCAFPTYMPVRKDIIDKYGDAWATKPKSYIGNGPYKMIKWRENSKIVFEKNPYYHNADQVKFNRIEFALTDDQGAMLANYMNGTFDFIDDVPFDEINSLKNNYADEFFVEGQLGTYYVNFNINSKIFEGLEYEDAVKFRKAISLMIDRDYIVTEIGKAGQQPANSFVPIGLSDADPTEQFVENNGPGRDGSGYYGLDVEANQAQAVELLKELVDKYGAEKGYKYNESSGTFSGFPTLTYLYNTSSGHKAIGEAIQKDLKKFGIEVVLKNQEWNTFLNTRKKGDYDFARNGWLGDYNDPISFLDMWTTNSGNNDVQFVRGAHSQERVYGENKNKSWSEVYDVLIQEIKTEKDVNKRYELMHQAEDMIMETGCIIPLYYYVDIFMIKSNVKGFFSTPTGFKYFMYAEKVAA